MDKPRIFISYSRLDETWAQEFADLLRNRGVRVWFDKYEVRPGDSWREAIEDGLRESDLIVTVISSENVRNPSLFFEIGAAIGMGKKIVPVVSEDLNRAALPQEFRTRKYLVKHSPQATADELLSQSIVPIVSEEDRGRP